MVLLRRRRAMPRRPDHYSLMMTRLFARKREMLFIEVFHQQHLLLGVLAVEVASLVSL
jgi:hypothetical protein